MNRKPLDKMLYAEPKTNAAKVAPQSINSNAQSERLKVLHVNI